MLRLWSSGMEGVEDLTLYSATPAPNYVPLDFDMHPTLS